MQYQNNQFLDYSEEKQLEMFKQLFIAYTITSDKVISDFRDFNPSENGKTFVKKVVEKKWNFIASDYTNCYVFREFAAKLTIIEFFNQLCIETKFLTLEDLFPNCPEDTTDIMQVLKVGLKDFVYSEFKQFIINSKAFDCIVYALDKAIKAAGSFETWSKFE